MESPIQYLEEKVESMEKTIVKVQTEPLFGEPDKIELARKIVTERLTNSIENFKKAILILKKEYQT